MWGGGPPGEPGGRKTSSHLFTYMDVPILVGSPEVQEHLQVGLSQENPLVREPPLQQNSLQKLFVSWCGWISPWLPNWVSLFSFLMSSFIRNTSQIFLSFP
jgi:hypothetical protein